MTTTYTTKVRATPGGPKPTVKRTLRVTTP